jgi:ribosomal protein L32
MKPIGVDKKDGKYILIHKCIKCGVEKRNKVSKEDSFEEIIKLS